ERTRRRRLHQDPGLAGLVRRPEQTALRAAAGQRGRALPRVRPGCGLPVCAAAQVHAVRRQLAAAVRAARPPGLRQERDRAGHLPRGRQPRLGGRPAALRRPGPRRGDGAAQRGRRRTAGPARGRRARRALQLRQAAGGLHAEGRAAGDRRARGAAGLARGDLLRGGGPAAAVGLLHHAADDGGGGPHGTARRDPAHRGAAVRAVHEVHARAPERVEQGQLPGAPVGRGPAGAGWPAGCLPRRGAVRAQGGGELPGSRIVGNRLAASEPEGPHARRRAAGGLHPPHRADGRAAAQAAGGQSDPAVLARTHHRRL
ncbi:MAG: 2-pyrone-4,6-dicarboxylic acid hydrolase, partial [uncultured Ramlibacter sp.]